MFPDAFGLLKEKHVNFEYAVSLCLIIGWMRSCFLSKPVFCCVTLHSLTFHFKHIFFIQEICIYMHLLAIGEDYYEQNSIYKQNDDFLLSLQGEEAYILAIPCMVCNKSRIDL